MELMTYNNYYLTKWGPQPGSVMEEKTLKLWNMEWAMLVYLARHANSFCSREIMLEQVWGYRNILAERDYDFYVNRLSKILPEGESVCFDVDEKKGITLTMRSALAVQLLIL
ncbi:helix-turn-helix domain-containing protein [Olivibacter domesticus]|uniref:Transcriptional regulatory protein, C terminal n=1 Tax=Olivibacter domesticus TaxID=407022 RepID=A0A1H7IHC8_OLID1|nr:helix-turn-helix domain-containing protein [Olivibacter domesticus]SEK61252.1 Transcriptional regulatory protein, C terminal [Olivibacter domesticus]